ncbi:hypothetical protein ACH4E7_23320 [Kitasatospora sp. NPDC018058]|uniref:hypothetical protein n=1 Tax=Kitasatospora sp. NPDC018058 TaxID=3364025 RepID=UPI0037C122C9
MAGHLLTDGSNRSGRTDGADRPWPIVVLAGASWLPSWTITAPDVNGSLLTIWGLLIALTLLPLCVRGDTAFRRVCGTFAAILLALETLVSAFTLFLYLPALVAFCPAGVPLLLARWNTGDTTRTVLAVPVATLPFLMAML